MAKKRTSRYRPGERSPDWVKIKVWAEQEVAVIGWLPRQGSTDDLGSLIVAVQGPDGLVHAGQVGSGLDGRTRRELLAAFAKIARSDPPVPGAPSVPGARWVEPRIVARVEFSEWTPDGLLRQPTFIGVLVDRDVSSTVRQDPPRRARRGPEAATPSAPPGTVVAVTADELAALDAMDKEGLWEIGGQVVKLTNLDKVLFPGTDTDPAPVTKRDLARYYVTVADALIPHLRHHGLTLQRFPDGVERKGFWQKDLPSHTPSWIRRRELQDSEGLKQYVVVDRVATLAWLAQEAAIELHPWTATIEAPDRPRYALIDIDPGEATTWEEVLVLARLFRTALGHLGVTGLPKTTGKRGLQVWVPIADRYSLRPDARLGRGPVTGGGPDRARPRELGVDQAGPSWAGAAGLHPERADPDACRRVQRPAGSRRAGLHAHHLGRARGSRAPSRPLDGPHPAAAAGRSGGPVRPGADPPPGSAAAGLRHEDATADVKAVASIPPDGFDLATVSGRSAVFARPSTPGCDGAHRRVLLSASAPLGRASNAHPNPRAGSPPRQ